MPAPSACAQVRGAWTLHRLSLDLDLDFFVLYSSVSSVLGTAQQAHYTAANGFLDGLAEYRRGLGLPALSINWGPWQNGGMIDGETARHIADSGFNALSAPAALALFGRLLAAGQTRVAVLDADWPRLKSLYEVRGRQPVLALLGQSASAASVTGSSAVLDALRDLAVRDRFDYLLSRLQEQVGAALRFDSNTLPDPKRGFFDMGMDSLTAVELKGRIEPNCIARSPLRWCSTTPMPKPWPRICSACCSPTHSRTHPHLHDRGIAPATAGPKSNSFPMPNSRRLSTMNLPL